MTYKQHNPLKNNPREKNTSSLNVEINQQHHDISYIEHPVFIPEITKNKKEALTKIINKNLIDKCLTDLLLEEVITQPNETSVIFNNMSLTFAELMEKSFELAIRLQQLGVLPDECVGLFVEPSLELMIGVWGILTSGAAYLPLSIEYPSERLRYIIEDSRTRIVICQGSLKEKLLECVSDGIKIVSIEELTQSQHADRNNYGRKLENRIRPEQLAYIIYTSGTTGKPKGVMVEHRSIVNQMNWLKNTFNFQRHHIILQKTPIGFDAAQWEILAPVFGCKVLMGDPGISKDPEHLIETIHQHQITTLQCVPTLLQALLRAEKSYLLQSLTHIFCGGEALSKQLAEECANVLPKTLLVNLYGPTECTINSSAHIYKLGEGNSDIVSIGKPIDHTHYYILDENKNQLKTGETGELYIGGLSLARGYLNKPELTAEKFVDSLFLVNGKTIRLYKTGDLASWNKNGTVQYVGRTDNQIKLRGIRIELDEIKSTIDIHDWVKNSAVIVKIDPATGYQNLIAFVELDERKAVLMDQGNHDSHHQSKKNKAQVKEQLSNRGCRETDKLIGKITIALHGKVPTEKQLRKVFRRKTYRFFEGNPLAKKDILQLLDTKKELTQFKDIDELNFGDFGEILRYFGQFISKERLLPKYGYASPGALYATQMYLELEGVGDLTPGYYYYHPVSHELFLIHRKNASGKTTIKIHFIGKRSAIEPIYKNNIQEVLEIETGHMVGLFDDVLSEYGYSIEEENDDGQVMKHLDVEAGDFYVGTFQITSGKLKTFDESLDIYVQAHGENIRDLEPGLYHFTTGKLSKVSDEIIRKIDVIAINQDVYQRSSFGITLTSKRKLDRLSYIELGRKLQHFQMNELNIGLMSSGYSSKTDHDLPSAKRIKAIIGNIISASYFFIGGPVSTEQQQSRGMKEDIVHMKGPAEMIKDDLVKFLPQSMLPNKVIILNKIPLTVHGKIDTAALKILPVELNKREYVAPRTHLEKILTDIWERALFKKDISIHDDFFELGGNSLIAVGLIHKMNKELHTSLSLQVLFETSTIEGLARKVSGSLKPISSRLIALQKIDSQHPIYCWPGLGGYCMNLRLFATKIGKNNTFYGIQANGINQNEIPYQTIKQMAAEDIKLIKEIQPSGPYILAGYSFGARVAFEVAYQLECSGEVVEHLFLIAPGAPKVQFRGKIPAAFRDVTFMAILLSVFTGKLSQGQLETCLKHTVDEDSFVEYITRENPQFGTHLVKRIIRIVSLTYGFNYSANELKEHQLSAPITLFKAKGDQNSFIETYPGLFADNLKIIKMNTDHYNMLKEPAIDRIAEIIRTKTTTKQGEKPCHTST